MENSTSSLLSWWLREPFSAASIQDNAQDGSVDLEIPESLWNELRNGITWLIEQLFNFTAMLQESKRAMDPRR